MSATVTMLSPPSITAYQVSPTTSADVVVALEVATALGYAGNIVCETQGGEPVWVATLSLSGYPDQVANEGDWIVIAGTQATVYPPELFAATFTGDFPLVWAATDSETAPLITALGGGKISIVFPQPTSANSPFTYTADVTDANSTAAATLQSEPAVADGMVTLIATGLTTSDLVTATVTVNTQYDVTATSAVSNSVAVL